MNEIHEVPFKHLIQDTVLFPGELECINAEWSQGTWSHKKNKGTDKSYSEYLPPTAHRVVQRLTSPSYLAFLSDTFGIHDLLPDPETFGAGRHEIHAGGFLRMHVDFNQHPSGLWRRLSLLLYVNERWENEWRGELILSGDKEYSCIVPNPGVAVTFATTETSWHGHPVPLATPDGISRRSIAIYYYTKEAPSNAAEPHTTIYRLGDKEGLLT